MLLNALRSYPSSYVFIFDDLLDMLTVDPVENHEMFKVRKTA